MPVKAMAVVTAITLLATTLLTTATFNYVVTQAHLIMPGSAIGGPLSTMIPY